MASLLIVEDDETVLNLMVSALKEADFEVASATTGQAALDHLSSAKFNLLITDIMLPDISGLDVIDHAIVNCPDIIILAISGGGPNPDQCSEDLLDTALTSGADAILQKPFLPAELIRTARALIA